MEAGKFNILIEKKATFRQDFTLYSAYNQKTSTGTPLDLTGCTAVAKIKTKITDATAILTFTTSVPDPTNGVFRIELSASQTAAIGWQTGVYDVLLTFPSGDVQKWIEGNVVIGKTVS